MEPESGGERQHYAKRGSEGAQMGRGERERDEFGAKAIWFIWQVVGHGDAPWLDPVFFDYRSYG